MNPTPTLTILIVGAGLAGLSASIQCALAGHTVTILEASPALSQFGAGLQLTPNATRLLQSWGVYPLLRGPCEPRTCTVYNYRGNVLAREEGFAETCRRDYGAPVMGCHRGDLVRALVGRAEEVGVRIVWGARVKSINFEYGDEDGDGDGKGRKKALVLAEGPAGGVFTADLVVGADGLWSTCRSLFLGRRDPPLPTGDMVYRIVLEEEKITDEELRKLVKEQGLRFWIGPGAHVVAYSLRGGTTYNVVLHMSEGLASSVGQMEENFEQMRKLFEGWDPFLTRLFSQSPQVTKWQLLHRAPLPTFHNATHNLLVIGDASHPMLPYLAQGASSSIEDGAVLGLLLSPSHFKSKGDLPHALRTFEKLRKERSERIARETLAQRRDFCLRDGEEQRERDERMMRGEGRGGEGQNGKGFPCRWMDERVKARIFGYDAGKDVEGVSGW